VSPGVTGRTYPNAKPLELLGDVGFGENIFPLVFRAVERCDPLNDQRVHRVRSRLAAGDHLSLGQGGTLPVGPADRFSLSVDTRLAVSTANDGVQNGRLRHEVNDLFHQK